MTFGRRGLAYLLCACLAAGPSLAQSVTITRGILEDQPYTLIYPEGMMVSGGVGEPVSINHPNVPLQCDLTIVRVEDTSWTPQQALADFDEEAVAAEWAEVFPGFSIAGRSVVMLQHGEALRYDGESTDSPLGLPITLVHTETVESGRGYILDCLFASEIAAEARPVVDFIIANFSTRADGECCVGAEPAPAE